MMAEGWDGLREAEPKKQASDENELDLLITRVFSTEDGVKLLEWLRSITIEQPTWYPGEDPSHGFAREGQNSLVRELERRIKRARSK
jgi:hypothetical protein